jgi:hypothetical protein
VPSFEEDFDWQRQFAPEIKRILGSALIVAATPEEDLKHNTDFMVLELASVRVACRVRTNWYLHQRDWRNQFTIRSTRPSGVETELVKVLSGWGDFIFYGFADQDNTALAAWVLGNLKAFRSWHASQLWRGLPAGIECSNGDKSSKFRAYRIADMPADFVVDRKFFSDGRFEPLPI